MNKYVYEDNLMKYSASIEEQLFEARKKEVKLAELELEILKFPDDPEIKTSIFRIRVEIAKHKCLASEYSFKRACFNSKVSTDQMESIKEEEKREKLAVELASGLSSSQVEGILRQLVVKKGESDA